MLNSIEGTYRNGKIELAEVPSNIDDDTRVIVTFLKSRPIDLRKRGIDEAQAADLRSRLSTFAEDWNSPEMDIYDDYNKILHIDVSLRGIHDNQRSEPLQKPWRSSCQSSFCRSPSLRYDVAGSRLTRRASAESVLHGA